MATNITHRNVGDTTTKIQDKEDTSKTKKPKSSRWKQFVVLIAFWTALVLGATWYFRQFNASKSAPEGGFDLTTLNIPFKRSGGAHAKDHFILSKEDLKHYDGSDPNLPILLVVKGHIFDVSSGRNYYGPGSGYNFFCGRDGTRSFSTGCFDQNDEKCTKDSHVYQDLDEAAQKAIDDWETFYRESTKYHYIGEVRD